MGDWSAARQLSTSPSKRPKVSSEWDDGPPELVPPDEFRGKAHWHDASQGPDHPLDA
jgi:hypothetical protein